MVTVILSHDVKDFSSWKTLFEEGESLRAQAGIKVSGVYTAADNPNRATVITEFPSLEVVTAFMGNPELKSAMEKGGVIGTPTVQVLNKV